ncbi:hypothetical protein LSH36_190g04012 [Paralvinella palmiformis]|uniref:Ion transport domain-containing protein n=1 Tax=Paralvinella palmiformis TaxID=53620 RepID=A0AAD9JQT1_9ANNE|nr:hypothetical protein LSH36_190g04012 [Paralvinella palmiformis]
MYTGRSTSNTPLDDRPTSDRHRPHYPDDDLSEPRTSGGFLGFLAGPRDQFPLHMACSRPSGVLTIVQQLIRATGKDCRMAMDKDGATPLFLAAECGNTTVCRELLQHAGEQQVTQLKQVDGHTPLHICAWEGDDSMNGEIALHIASRHGMLKMVQALLAEGADPTWQSKTGENPLHIAVRYCHWEVADELVTFITREKSHLDAVMLVNQQNVEGETPIHYAGELTKNHAHHEFEDTDMMKLLLLYDGDVNLQTKLTQETPLHYCARAGNADIMIEIVKHIGPSKTQSAVNKQAKNGWSPLLVASEQGHLDIVKILLKHNARVDVFDEHGKAALHLAGENGHEGVADVLLWHRAFVNAKSKLGVTPLHLAAENGYMKLQGQTPLHLAAENDHSDVVKLFLKHRPELVTMANTNGMTCAHIAASKGSVAVVKELMRFNKTVVTTARNRTNDSTALHLASAGGHADVVRVLLDAGASATDENATGFTALHVAARYGQTEFVREMLSKVPATVCSEPPHTGATDVTRETGPEHGFTPLHMAAQSGHEGLVRVLLNYPGVQADAPTVVNLHVKDKRGRTGLHLAASNGHLDMVALLLGQGADIDVYDKVSSPKYETKDGKVPICYAAAFNHAEVLSYLMKKGHDTHILMEDKKFTFDLMVVGKQSNNACIEEFILVSKAPVETAVKLSQQFRLLAIKEKERAKDLVAVGDYCESMATELNAIASSINGAGMLLKSVDNRGSPFLDILIECEQKEVVSHPSVQKYLSEVWMGHLSHWSGWKMLVLFIMMLVVPPVWLALSLPFKHNFNKVPVIKFMSYLVSHIYLIVLFILTVVIPLVPISWSGDLLPHWYEWLLLAWLSGLIVSQLTNPEDRAGLGWIKVIILVICVVGVCVHIIGFAFPFSVKPDDQAAGVNNKRLECIYIRNQFFGFALMLCFAQLMDFLSFHHLFGPWAIIIRDLMKDLVRFLVILSIFMAGFTLNLAAVYQPVYDAIPQDPDKGNGTGAGGAITDSVIQTFEMLFFALFGLVEPESLPPIHRNPSWSVDLAKIVFGIYLLVSLIVLINLLIAMMSDTYQRIQAQSDTEWKFGRAKLFRNMNKTSATPSPLNLHYIDEEEDLETHMDARAADGQGPHGANNNFLADANISRATMRIDEVVNWKQVVDKYLAVSGRSEGQLALPTDRFDDSNTQPDNSADTKPAGETDLPV